MAAEHKHKIPERLKESLSARDQTPMSEDDFLKFQLISMLPGIARNFRYLIKNDGELFYAENKKESTSDRMQIYNVEMPVIPTRKLSSEEISEIHQKITEINFFEQPAFQSVKARDGSLAIVTVRLNDKVHEVWFLNTHNTLTDLLHSLSPYEPVEKSTMEKLASLNKILHDLQQQISDISDTSINHLDGEDENPLE